MYYTQIYENQTNTYFGSISYQQLILTRTQIIMELFQFGFTTIIADTQADAGDAVWLQNPKVLYEEYEIKNNFQKAYVDLYVVPDEPNELCGCFLILKATNNTLLFWKYVLIQHQQLIQTTLLVSNQQTVHMLKCRNSMNRNKKL